MRVVDADELARLAKAMGDYGPTVYVAAAVGGARQSYGRRVGIGTSGPGDPGPSGSTMAA